MKKSGKRLILAAADLFTAGILIKMNRQSVLKGYCFKYQMFSLKQGMWAVF